LKYSTLQKKGVLLCEKKNDWNKLYEGQQREYGLGAARAVVLFERKRSTKSNAKAKV
jgi:hypothetical protein